MRRSRRHGSSCSALPLGRRRDSPATRGSRSTVGDEQIPEGVPVHLKLDTGMGRWGLSELPAPGRSVVGLMTHLATAESDHSFALGQLELFLRATEPYAGRYVRHVANSAAALTLPATRLDAARCGIALYGIDPANEDASRFGLRPALRWESELAQVRRLAPGESTGYGRRFAATEETWIGIVPVGYADGFRRDLTGTEVLVGDDRVPSSGAVSMDALAVRLPGSDRGGDAGDAGRSRRSRSNRTRASPGRSRTSSRARSGRRPTARRGWCRVIDKVARRLALQAERHAELEAMVNRLLAPLRGDEHALDVGCGTGALAFALAPHVRRRHRCRHVGGVPRGSP